MEFDLVYDPCNHSEQGGDMVDHIMFILGLIHIVDRDWNNPNTIPKSMCQRLSFYDQMRVGRNKETEFWLKYILLRGNIKFI